MPRLLAVALLVLAATLLGVDAASAADLGFGAPMYLDNTIAGGEPLVMTNPAHHTIVFTTHEGTTHIYRPGLASAVTFAPTYRNQVNIWISRNGGRTWKRDDFGGGFATDPTKNTGFSDPDLTMDASGRIYNTGINLANDALFSSKDGGLTWDRGTVQCHDGDRPWLAGGRADEVFLATNTSEGALSHQVFTSTDGGNTCATTGIPDAGTMPDGKTTYTGNGKLYYEHASQRLVEPVNFMDDNGKTVGLGVGTWQRGHKEFTPHLAVNTSVYAHWAAIALDDEGGLYLTWDNDPRAAGTAGGCDNAETPVPHQVSLVYSHDFGTTWSTPQTIAAPAGKRVFWPWITAGDKGKVNVVWYQTDKVVDLACQDADISVLSATVTGADTASPSITTADAVGRPISHNNICQSGTTCVATGEDRRLGDFFTNAVDEQGCVIIGTGDTMQKDPITGGDRLTALPLFLHQNRGPALRGGGDCSGTKAKLGLPAAGAEGVRGQCVSRRSFRIRLRHPKGDALRRATVYVRGKRVKVLSGRRLRSAVDLRGLPKGRF